MGQPVRRRPVPGAAPAPPDERGHQGAGQKPALSAVHGRLPGVVGFMTKDDDLESQLSRALLQLRAKNPFFATLALFAHLEWREEIATAATDGRDIVFNPAFAATLTPAEFQAVLLHEVLHCALLHVMRRASREPELWNIAADIVVNGMIIRSPI